jgi:MFS family permease
MSVSALRAPPVALVFLLAASCGIIVANIYYAQPLVGLIAPAIGLSSRTASLIVTVTQLGYASGLLLLVPLGDIIENRLLLTISAASAVLPLLAAGFAHSGMLFLAASAAIGLTSVAVQMLVPLAANLAPDHLRGRIVGNVMSGLLLGILLARRVFRVRGCNVGACHRLSYRLAGAQARCCASLRRAARLAAGPAVP